MDSLILRPIARKLEVKDEVNYVLVILVTHAQEQFIIKEILTAYDEYFTFLSFYDEEVILPYKSITSIKLDNTEQKDARRINQTYRELMDMLI